jgi:nitronate monooxygenase
MGDLTTPALAAAVSDAGGLGGLGMWGYSGEDAERRIAGFRQMTGGALNVNYPLWDDPGDLTGIGGPMRARLEALYAEAGLGPMPEPRAGPGGVSEEHLDVLRKMKPEVVSFHFGLPDRETLDAIRAEDIFVVSSATTVAEARALEAAGVDAVIAQGIEAGGHRGTFEGAPVAQQPGLMALLPQVVDAVSVPVIAAGGIADGRGVAAAMVLGASAVQVGTAFLRCEEADVADQHVAALGEAGDADTVVTPVISGRPARFIRNRLIDDLSGPGAEPLPFPAQASLTHPLAASGDRDVTALYAGQSGALTRALPAGELVRILAGEAEERLRAFR